MVGASGNSYANVVGTSGNAYTQSVGSSANAYASAVGASANANSLPKTGGTISGDLTVTGNLTISGVTTYSNTQTLNVGDNIITLNADVPVSTAPSENAGVEVNRGSSSDVSIIWNETSDKWTFTNDGTNYRNVASNSDIESVATSANGYSSGLVTSANGYIASVATSANAYAQSVGTAANAYATAMNTSGNAYAQAVGTAGNAYAVVVGTSSNNYTSTTYATKNNPTFTGTATFTGNVAINANINSQTLTDGSTISWDVAQGSVATVTLGGNRTLANATNTKVGTYILHVIQDGTGSRTLAFSSSYKWPAGVAPTLTTTVNARDVFSFICDGTNMYGSFLPDVK